MLLLVNRVADGPGPGEVLVTVRTANGRQEEVIVHERALSDQNLEIGHPISQQNGHLLVELPREAMSGLWRVWVDRDQVVAR
jgi:hypothetical protein